MAEHFHWTLEYVERLPYARLQEWHAIAGARASGRAERDRRERFLKQAKGRR
jgi:hypothetical protein